MGGAIAFEILKQNVWNGPMIMICPAFLNVKSICYGQKINYSNLALLEQMIINKVDLSRIC